MYVHSPTPNVQYRADSHRHLFVLLLLFSFFLVCVSVNRCQIKREEPLS
jgi:hypothetical protein